MDLPGSWYARKDVSNCTLIIIFEVILLVFTKLKKGKTANKKAEDRSNYSSMIPSE